MSNTITKTCSNCGNIVPNDARPGQRCSHCGAIWSKEKKQKNHEGLYSIVGLAIIILMVVGIATCVRRIKQRRRTNTHIELQENLSNTLQNFVQKDPASYIVVDKDENVSELTNMWTSSYDIKEVENYEDMAHINTIWFCLKNCDIQIPASSIIKMTNTNEQDGIGKAKHDIFILSYLINNKPKTVLAYNKNIPSIYISGDKIENGSSKPFSIPINSIFQLEKNISMVQSYTPQPEKNEKEMYNCTIAFKDREVLEFNYSYIQDTLNDGSPYSLRVHLGDQKVIEIPWPEVKSINYIADEEDNNSTGLAIITNRDGKTTKGYPILEMDGISSYGMCLINMPNVTGIVIK